MMIFRDRDSAITEALRRGTDRVAQHKGRVWKAVSGRLAEAGKERMRENMRKKRNRFIVLASAAAAAALAFVFVSFTPQGTALADRIVKFFAPEKKIDTQIEGATETQRAALQGNTSEEMGYVIYIDSERYHKETQGDMDVYKALSFPEGYPPVQMEISQLKDRGAEEAYGSLLAEAKEQFDVAEGQGKVEEPVKGWALFAYDDGGGEKPYEDVFVVDNTKGGCFIIRCRMFREATEGHGARFQAMLRTFEIVRSSQLETASPELTPAPKPELRKLTWDDLAIYGVKLDTSGKQAIDALIRAIDADIVSDEATDDGTAEEGPSDRIVQWADGTVAIVRNRVLYSIEVTAPSAALPFGLRTGMSLEDFKAVLGEPHEAIGALAWGVGSNDNLIVKVTDGCVVSVKISLVE